MNNKISIVIPAYNIENYIARCLKSIINQTYKNLEIIVVDDGSRDSTAEIIKKYSDIDSRIIYIHQENAGVMVARINGIRQATGEFIGFVDGDDCIDSWMYERLLNNALEYHADISHCGYKMIFPNGRIDYYYNRGIVVEQNNLKGMEDLIIGEFVEPGLCNKLYRKQLFENIPLDELLEQDIRNFEDLLLNYFLFKQSFKSIYEDICPYHYILRKDSATTSKINIHNLEDPMRVLDIILKDLDFQNNSLVNVVQGRRIRQMINVLSISSKGQKELILPYQRQIQNKLREEIKGSVLKNSCTVKMRIMAIWISKSPRSYRGVHSIYAKLKGIDKKYSVE